jgi:hypothetical protein
VLSVLVSSVTLARGRFMRQWGDAQRKAAVTEAVDRMIASWLGGDGADNIPVPARGVLDGVEGATWRTDWVPNPAANRLGAGGGAGGRVCGECARDERGAAETRADGGG